MEGSSATTGSGGATSGSAAGPVLAAAVILPADLPPHVASLLDDSKKLSAVARGIALVALRASGAVIGVGAASVAEIEQLNILHAAMLAMQRAGAFTIAQDEASCTVFGMPRVAISLGAASIFSGSRRAPSASLVNVWP